MNTTRRLKMQGKAITVDSVMEEVEQAARRLGGTSKSFANHMRRDGSVRQRFGRIGNWLSNLVGLGLLGFGAFLLIVFVVFLLSGQHIIPLYSDQGYVSVSELGSLVFASEGDLFLAWLGGGIVASAVILLLISNGCYLLMRIRNRWTKLSSISLFLFGVLGVGICVYLGAITSTEFVYEEELEREVASVSCSELKLDVWNGNKKRIGEFEIKKGRNFGFVSLKKEEICNAGIEILYRKSSDSLYHIYQNFSADGKYSKQAMKRARNLNHKIHLEGNVLRIESYYHFPKKDKFRNQSVQVIIEIPKDKFVRVKDNRISVDYLEYGETEREGYLNYDGEFEYWY